MGHANDRICPTFLVGTTQTLRVDGLPLCTIQQTADGMWHMTTQLAADEQAALTVAAPDPAALCRRAQHALGLAGISLRIEPDHAAIGVYAAALPSPSGEFLLILEGRSLLLSVSRASSEALRALIAAATPGSAGPGRTSGRDRCGTLRRERGTHRSNVRDSAR